MVIEDWSQPRLVKEKRKGEKPPISTFTVTGLTNPVLIVPVGSVRPMQILVGSVPVLLLSQLSVASIAKSSKPAALAMPMHFLRNVPNGADPGVIRVEQPQTYKFPQKYLEWPITQMYYEESDKKF